MAGPLPEPQFIRIGDAVHRFSLSRSIFDRALAAGDLRRFKRGHAVLLELAEVEAWVRSGAKPEPRA